MVNNHRKTKTGGGMAICIKDLLHYKHREDLDSSNADIECVFFELDKGTLNFNRNVIVGVVYRLPDKDISVFTTVLHAILKTTQRENCLLSDG